ncbi:FMN-binding protein [Fusobacterium sp.]|uniref:FMN-binding protein n=1 Tax=Fusobacterium sp. TaxID=68766 RepID=UPI00396C4037
MIRRKVNVEKIRKYCVIAFIVAGLAALVVEKVNGPEVYEGEGEGFADSIKVQIAAKKENGKIKIVDVKYEHGDTDAVATPAIEELITKLKETHDLASLDIISGASYTSEGFIDAVNDAVSKIK